MIANDDPLFRHLPFLAPDRLRFLIAHAGGLLAQHSGYADAARVLDRVSAKLLEQDPQRSMRGILSAIALEHELSLEELRGPSRARHITIPRQEAMWRMRQVRLRDGAARFSYPAIAEFLGNRDHATIIHGVRAHERRLAEAQGRAA